MKKLNNRRLVIVSLFGALLFSANAYALDLTLGYPYMMWGEISHVDSSKNAEEGIKLDGYFEQGVDFAQLGPWKANAFVALRGTVSDDSEDFWNNKYGPYVGLKLKLDGTAPGGGWSQLAVGARLEHLMYQKREIKDDSRFVLYVQWGFGGDWSR